MGLWSRRGRASSKSSACQDFFAASPVPSFLPGERAVSLVTGSLGIGELHTWDPQGNSHFSWAHCVLSHIRANMENLHMT
jgi:hypothetical protein